MSTASVVSRAFEVFRADTAAPPPLTLRGANAVDSYDHPMPFDPAADEPTDAYVISYDAAGTRLMRYELEQARPAEYIADGQSVLSLRLFVSNVLVVTL